MVRFSSPIRQASLLYLYPIYPPSPWLKVKARVNVVYQPTARRDFTCMYQPAQRYSVCVQKPPLLSPLLAFPSSLSLPLAFHLKPPSDSPVYFLFSRAESHFENE